MKQNQRWEAWFKKQSECDREVMALRVIERLIEIGEVRFRDCDDYDKSQGLYDTLYWKSSGEDLTVPF